MTADISVQRILTAITTHNGAILLPVSAKIRLKKEEAAFGVVVVIEVIVFVVVPVR